MTIVLTDRVLLMNKHKDVAGTHTEQVKLYQ
jgi:hypothetical protein